jgi:hypothetical protein
MSPIFAPLPRVQGASPHALDQRNHLGRATPIDLYIWRATRSLYQPSPTRSTSNPPAQINGSIASVASNRRGSQSRRARLTLIAVVPRV